MHDRPATFALRARLIFPVAAAPLEGAYLTIDDGKVEAVSKSRPRCPIQDLGDSAIVPGLVNAHTHLEFSDLEDPLGLPGMPFPDWIGHVVRHRQARTLPAAQSVALGLAECLRTGTVAVGEIATDDWRTRAEIVRSPARVVMFREAIAPTEERIAEEVDLVSRFLSAELAADVCDAIHPAISPHAPYSVHPQLLAQLIELAVRRNAPLAMHLAESLEELELVESGSGPFRERLEALGAWDGKPGARHGSLLAYLEQLSQAPRALVIHGNYLDAGSIEFMAQHAGSMSLVFCPRTHHYFRHTRYPLAERLAAGVQMALGTDSRASNPSLDMFEEMQFVAARHTEVNPSAVLEMGTLGGAKALGLAGSLGTLEPGKQADLAIVALTQMGSRDPHEQLFALGTHVADTWIGGVRVD